MLGRGPLFEFLNVSTETAAVFFSNSRISIHLQIRLTLSKPDTNKIQSINSIQTHHRISEIKEKFNNVNKQKTKQNYLNIKKVVEYLL